jgi:predicted phage terminase large subunit-like protein
MSNNIETVNALIRNDLTAMIRKSFETLNEGSEFLPNWHIDAIAYKLEECVRGNIKRLIITLPPRYLKSEISTVAFPSWILGNDPTRRIISVSYSDDLTRYFSRSRRKVMETPWFSEAFPKMQISQSKNTEIEMVTTLGGGCYSTSVGGTLTGRGGNFLIVDDPIKADGTFSEADRNAVNKWYQNTLYSRLNSKANDVIIIVMQRVHMDDLVGHVQNLDDWNILNLPAIAEEEAKIRIGPDEDDYYLRKSGEVLHKKRENLETLQKIKKAIGSYAFSNQYQQSPVPIEGNLIRREWLARFEGMPNKNQFDYIVQSWDTAAGKEVTNNFSVCTTWGIQQDGCYLLHVLRERLEFPDLAKAVQEQADIFRPRTILIENASSGQSLIQTLNKESILTIDAVKTPTVDKENRLAQASISFEQGRVFLPKEAPWLADFEKELLTFPGTKFDDQVDSTSQFILWHLDPKRGGYKFAIAQGKGVTEKNGRVHSKTKRTPHPNRDPRSPRARRY